MSMVEWYRFADAYLSLASDDDAFQLRFLEIYRDMRATAPGASRIRVQCRVAAAQDPAAIHVRFQGVADPAGHLTGLLLALSYEPGPRDAGDQLRFTPPQRDWPTVACRAGSLVVDRGGPWQWLVAHLAVSLVLALQPEFLFFHAAAVAIRGRGVLLMGAQGHGKTSVSLALAALGHDYLSDEIGAVRLATRDLVPMRRAALVRPPTPPASGPARLVVPASELSGSPGPHVVPLRAIVCLRRFASTTRLERIQPDDHLGLITPMACSLSGGDGGGRTVSLLRLLSAVDCYALDAATPQSAADQLDRLLASGAATS